MQLLQMELNLLLAGIQVGLCGDQGSNVVAVNIYVPESGFWTGDIPLILHNAAYWASSCGWLSAEPESGTIPAGSSMDITMKFDAAV